MNEAVGGWKSDANEEVSRIVESIDKIDYRELIADKLRRSVETYCRRKLSRQLNL